MSGLEFLAAIIGAITIAAGPTILAWRSTRKVEKVETAVAKVQTTADEIHVLTNSNLTAVKAALEAAEKRIVSLEELVTKLAARGIQ